MLFSRVLFGFLSLSLALSHPLTGRNEDSGIILARSPPKSPAKPPAKSPIKPMLYTGNDFESQARKANNAPGRTVPKACKKVVDCSCPKSSDPKVLSSTSCINGFCSCNNPAVSLFGKTFLEGVAAVGNAPITKAISHLMQGLADVKEVAGIIAGAFLGPEARLALKVALQAFPDVGPSHIDQATKGILGKVLG